MDPTNEFSPESMTEWAKSLAEESARKLTSEERLDAIRAVVGAFLEYGVIDASDIDEPGGSFTAAAQSLYMCHLVPMIFADAYQDAEAELDGVDAARQQAIESLKRSFNL